MTLSEWNRENLSTFLQQHLGSLLELKEFGGGLSLKGRVTDFSELDLCGRLLVEAKLSLETEGLRVDITLHKDLLGVQVSWKNQEEDPEFIIAREVSYKRLVIKVLDEP